MLTRSDIPKLLTAGLKTEFFKAYDWLKTIYQDFTTEVPSNKASEIYAWLWSTPTLRKWRDERQAKGLRENGFTLVNEDYEATLEVHRNALDDDQYGQIKIRAQQLGSEAKKGYDIFAAATVEAGVSSVCYDGQNFFDTDHLEGDSGVQSNYSASWMPLNATNVKTIIATMGSYKNDQGQLAWVNPTHIMIPKNLEYTAKEIFDPQFVKVSTNPSQAALSGVLQVIVNPYLSQTGGANAAYYVLDLSQPVKPFIFQNRQKMTFAALDNAEAYENFMRKKIYYGVDARFAFGYGDWKLAYYAKG